MLTKTITIGGKEVTFKSSASTIRLYRAKFKRDILVDLNKLAKSVDKKKTTNVDISIEDLEIFENVAYIMAFQGDPEHTPGNINDWLDQFEMFSIYEILEQLTDLWGENLFSNVQPSKNSVAPQGK